MEKVLLEEYERCVTQENYTPYIQHSMKEVLGNIISDKIADEIMQWTFVPPDNVDKIREVFKYLSLNDGMESVHIPTSMKIEECQ